MSGWTDLSEITALYSANCVLSHPNSIITEFFVVYNFWPIFLTFVVIGITLVQYEYTYFLLTVVMLADGGINYGLQQAYGDSTNFQPPTCPIEPKQLPALAAERITVLYIVGWFLVTYIYPRAVDTSKIWMFNIAAVLSLYARLYLIFSTPVQMLAGTVVGFVEGLLFSWLFLWIKEKGIDRVLIDAPGFCLFPALSDSLAYTDTPTYVTNSKPKLFLMKYHSNPSAMFRQEQIIVDSESEKESE